MSDGDCPTGQTCNTVSKRCECAQNSNCRGGQTCNTSIKRCECAQDSDCTAGGGSGTPLGEQICNLRTKRCECKINTDSNVEDACNRKSTSVCDDGSVMNWSQQGAPICLDERELVKDFSPASESPSTEYVPDFRHSRGAKCNEYLIGDGSDYRGCQTRTRRGYVCQKWSAQRPRTPHSGLTSPGDHNYCRNPNGSPNSQTTIWCYIHNQLYPDSDAEDLAWEYLLGRVCFDFGVSKTRRSRVAAPMSLRLRSDIGAT